MSISELKSQFASGDMVKSDYIERLHSLHRILFQYAEILSTTDIGCIEITDEGVVMASRSAGVRLWCDPQDRRVAPIEVLNFGRYEPNESAILFRLLALHQGAFTFFDVGANVGWYSLHVAKAFPQASIFAFEPVPHTFRQLERNIALNSASNVHPQRLALSDDSGETTFYFRPELGVNASSVDFSRSGDSNRVQCMAETLDAFALERQLVVDFVKCDVEGAELLVFSGAVDVLSSQQPIVFAEMLRKWSAGFGYHPNDLIDFFSRLGYRCFTPEPGGLREFFWMSDDSAETNFLYLHAERHRELIGFLGTG